MTTSSDLAAASPGQDAARAAACAYASMNQPSGLDRQEPLSTAEQKACVKPSIPATVAPGVGEEAPEYMRQFEVIGTPEDLGGARDLATRDKYQFQWWACSLVNAQPYQGKKKGADGGIDGLIFFQDDENAADRRTPAGRAPLRKRVRLGASFPHSHRACGLQPLDSAPAALRSGRTEIPERPVGAVQVRLAQAWARGLRKAVGRHNNR